MVGKFTKPLTNRKEYETTTFECNCTVDDEVVSVQWHLNDVEIVPGVPHFEKFEFHDEGRKRIMIIKDCPMDFNNGTFKCTSDIGKKLFALKNRFHFIALNTSWLFFFSISQKKNNQIIFFREMFVMGHR